MKNQDQALIMVKQLNERELKRKARWSAPRTRDYDYINDEQQLIEIVMGLKPAHIKMDPLMVK